MNDPKYDILEGKLWHRAGAYAVPDEEPVMIIRGKDPVAIRMIEAYIASNPDEAHVQSATERLNAFREYQEKYPERARSGCHNHQ